jgi:hypothetical protein
MAKDKETTNELLASDIALAVQIIDAATEKGVFKGADLKPVGEARERLIEWVKTNAPHIVKDETNK